MALAIVQARMGSNRLPGKVLAPVQDTTVMLELVVKRVRLARSVAKVVVATSVEPQDNDIEEWCRGADVDLYRGPEIDVLKRFVGCVTAFPNYSLVVRITGDCPLIDPVVIDTVAERRGGARYVRNTWFSGSYPSGFDCEIFTTKALHEHHAALSPLDPSREHVMSTYRPVVGIPFDSPLPAIDKLHLSVDTDADLALVRRVLERVPRNNFTLLDVIATGDSINLELNLTEQRRTHFDGARQCLSKVVAVQNGTCLNRIHPVALATLVDKRVLITGGTGSLGTRLLHQMLEATGRTTSFVILSRDELKQSLQRDALAAQHRARVHYILADIRDRAALDRAFTACDIVIHAAALKHVGPLEENPREAISTNIIGSMNVLDAAAQANVQRVLCLSTDKASAPCNTYGCSKMMLERLAVAADEQRVRTNRGPRVSVLRYGNVIGSRGSVIPLFNKRAKAEEPLPVTSFKMTRFLITLDQAVAFVLNCLVMVGGGQVFVPVLPKFSLQQLVDVAYSGCTTVESGIRPGEKLHECMVSADELHRSYVQKKAGLIIIEPSTKKRSCKDLESRLETPYTSARAAKIPDEQLRHMICSLE